MSEIEPMTMYHLDPDKYEMRVEMVYQDSVLDEMARRVGDKLDKEILARLGYVKVVRCRECKYDTLDHTDHDYRETLYCGFHRMDVSPERYCAWGKRREETE